MNFTDNIFANTLLELAVIKLFIKQKSHKMKVGRPVKRARGFGIVYGMTQTKTIRRNRYLKSPQQPPPPMCEQIMNSPEALTYTKESSGLKITKGSHVMCTHNLRSPKLARVDIHDENPTSKPKEKEKPKQSTNSPNRIIDYPSLSQGISTFTVCKQCSEDNTRKLLSEFGKHVVDVIKNKV